MTDTDRCAADRWAETELMHHPVEFQQPDTLRGLKRDGCSDGHLIQAALWIRGLFADFRAERERNREMREALAIVFYDMEDDPGGGWRYARKTIAKLLAPPASSPCATCGGEGQIEVGSGQPNGEGGEASQIIDCPACSGTGRGEGRR